MGVAKESGSCLSYTDALLHVCGFVIMHEEILFSFFGLLLFLHFATTLVVFLSNGLAAAWWFKNYLTLPQFSDSPQQL